MEWAGIANWEPWWDVLLVLLVVGVSLWAILRNGKR